MQQVLWRIPLKTAWTPEGIPLYGFGAMLLLAFLLCTWLASRRAARLGIAKENIQDMVIWLFVGGLLGARISHLLGEQPWGGWAWFFTQLPQIWNGGIIFYGSVLGGLVGYVCAWWFIFRKYKTSTLTLADILAPSIAVGLCLGRIGCFLNGCCYGQVACADCAVYPTVHFPLSAPARVALVRAGDQTAAGFTLSEPQPAEGARVDQVVPHSPAWAAGLRSGDVIVQVDGMGVEELAAYLKRTDDEYPIKGRTFSELFSVYLGQLGYWPRGKTNLSLSVVHEGETGPTALPPYTPRTLGLYPTQLYESVSMVLLLLVLLAYEPFRHRDGQVMAVLMMGYAVHRFLNEILRDDPRPVGFERYTSVFLFAAGLILWVWLQWKPARAQVDSANSMPTPAEA
jgi:phosphatidylglycerol---prolipoprotein diacylglyceryl transferase